MSTKFSIKSTAEKAKKEGDLFIRFSGVAEPFYRACERTSEPLEMDAEGNAKTFKFVTGLDTDRVEFYKWFSEEEKEIIKKEIEELKPTIEKFYGGKARVADTNLAFWKREQEIAKLKVTHETVDIVKDTKLPQDALLYLSILSGAFSDIVAPNRDWAERYQIPHYLALETETLGFDDEDEITRSDAHGELAMLRREFGKDAIYILAWCLQYDTQAYGAYSHNTPEKDLINYHIKYIDGKLPMKGMRSKNFPKTFLEYAAKWRGAKTKELLYIEAYVKAGEWFNFITTREKKYVTTDGVALGNTVAEAVETLKKAKYSETLEKLRDQVEAKWKE